MCTTAAAFEIVTSPAAIEPASVFGLHYERGMMRAEVAREFRAAFKRAQKFGAFKGVKLSVTSERGSVNVRILAAPFAANNPRKLDANIRSGLAGARVATSDRMRLLVAQLEMLANLWRRDDSDLASDYHNANCFLFVTVDTDDRAERRAASARVAAASLRYAVACVDALAPLSDDRIELAIGCLLRGEFAEARKLAAAAYGEAPETIEGALGLAVGVACEGAENGPDSYRNAFAAAMPSVRRAVELAGRTAEEARGVCDAAMSA